MRVQAEQQPAAMRQALAEAREQLLAARALAAERQESLEKERAARAFAERVNALKDEFLAIVSHELRGPLSAIAGWAHILQRGASDEDFETGLEVIAQSVQVQAKLIEDLLDISRITSGKLRLEMQPLEPRSFIDAAVEAVRPAAEAKGIHIRKVLDLAAGPITGDANRLQQVMLNLLTNAVKFTPEQGSVEVALQRRGEQAEISVTDTGIATRQMIPLFAIVAPAMLIPSLLGARLYLGISETGFRKVVLALLTASGLAMLVSALPVLIGRW